MHAMRYAITLPSDYDMTIIRNRVAKSGHLMDGFQDLLSRPTSFPKKRQAPCKTATTRSTSGKARQA